MKTLSLFEGVGIELEYMLVREGSLDVLPACDQVMLAASGNFEAEIERGSLAWSNELVNHVIEIKTNGPATSLRGLDDVFAAHVDELEKLVEPLGGRLMPNAGPAVSTRLAERHWPRCYVARATAVPWRPVVLLGE